MSSVIANTVNYKVAESIMRAIISLEEAVELEEDENGILGTDLEPEISEDDEPSFKNRDSDWLSAFGYGESLNCIFIAIFKRVFHFCRN